MAFATLRQVSARCHWPALVGCLGLWAVIAPGGSGHVSAQEPPSAASNQEAAAPGQDPGQQGQAASRLLLMTPGQPPADLVEQPGWYFGSPAWSRDGKQVAYDACPDNPQNYRNAHLFVVGLEDRQPKDLGQGAQPDWSSDDSRLAFDGLSAGTGAAHMATDGSDIRQVAEDANSARWRPGAQALSFLSYSRGRMLMLYDFQTDEQRPLLAPGWNIYWGFQWSPDGQQVAATLQEEGRSRPNAVVVAKIHPQRPSRELIVCARAAEVFTSVAWTADGRQLIFAKRTGANQPFQLYTVPIDEIVPPTLLPGQDPLRSNMSAVYSPDGSQLVYVSQAHAAN